MKLTQKGTPFRLILGLEYTLNPRPPSGSKPPHLRPLPVILDIPVIQAFGWDDWGVGNPEERRQPPWHYPKHQQKPTSLPGLLRAIQKIKSAALAAILFDPDKVEGQR